LKKKLIKGDNHLLLQVKDGVFQVLLASLGFQLVNSLDLFSLEWMNISWVILLWETNVMNNISATYNVIHN